MLSRSTSDVNVLDVSQHPPMRGVFQGLQASLKSATPHQTGVRKIAQVQVSALSIPDKEEGFTQIPYS